MTVSEGQMMLATAYERPGFLRTIYLLALLAFVVWALTLVIGMFAPEVTIGLAAPGGAPTVWSRYGAWPLSLVSLRSAFDRTGRGLSRLFRSL